MKKKKLERVNATTKRQNTILFFPFAVVEQKALRMKRNGTHCKALSAVDTDVLSIVTQQNKPNMNIWLLLFVRIALTPSLLQRGVGLICFLLLHSKKISLMKGDLN